MLQVPRLHFLVRYAEDADQLLEPLPKTIYTRAESLLVSLSSLQPCYEPTSALQFAENHYKKGHDSLITIIVVADSNFLGGVYPLITFQLPTN